MTAPLLRVSNASKQFGGLTISEVQWLRELEKENSRLKRLLAERDLEVDALKELLSKKR